MMMVNGGYKEMARIRVFDYHQIIIPSSAQIAIIAVTHTFGMVE